MGNWRTVTIVGSCPPDEVSALQAACDPHKGGAPYGNFHCLSIGSGLCGLGSWPAEQMDVSGNLAERDYDVDQVESTLRQIHEDVPGLRVKIHCGYDWESADCIATVICDAEGVRTVAPEVPRIRGASSDEMNGRFLQQMLESGL